MFNWVPDLTLNLVAEILGIIATVFFVDRLFKKREDARWMPSKFLFYSKLLSLLNELIFTTLQPSLRVPSYVYYFDKVSAHSVDFDLKTSDSKIKTELWEELKKYTRKLSHKKKLEKRDQILQAGNKVSDLVGRSMPLIEPELLSELIELNNTLDRIDDLFDISRFEQEPSSKSKKEKDTVMFALTLYDIAVAAEKPKLWLESKASFKMSSEEFILSFENTKH